MTLTLNIPTNPAQADAAYQEKLRKAAAALFDAGLITPEQVTELAGPSSSSPSVPTPLRQGSPEWKALLRRPGPARGVALSQEATSRESIYGDDGR